VPEDDHNDFGARNCEITALLEYKQQAAAARGILSFSFFYYS
jgi:hypothetical protein